MFLKTNQYPNYQLKSFQANASDKLSNSVFVKLLGMTLLQKAFITDS